MYSFENTDIVFSAGFEDELRVESTNSSRIVSNLSANHDEADTRIILLAVNCTAQNIIVMAPDTDVVLLLIHHLSKFICQNVWVMGGTSSARKFIPIHKICSTLSPDRTKYLMAFHAVTGCDSTSKLASITKTAAWKTFEGGRCSLLDGLGQRTLPNNVSDNVEKFIVQLYKVRVTKITKKTAISTLQGYDTFVYDTFFFVYRSVQK